MLQLLKKLFTHTAKIEQPLDVKVDDAVNLLIEELSDSLSDAKQELSSIDDAITALMVRRSNLAAVVESAKNKHAALHLVTCKPYEDVE